MNKDVIIGKYTLETLTNGMYSDPLDLYREYIQNAVDSIDAAKEIDSEGDYEIQIDIDDERKSICIKDNGLGVSSDNIISALINIGNSKKDKQKTRGFRGIGRLAGLGYCDTLSFETTYKGEAKKSIVSFDAKLLRQLLLDTSGSVVSIHDVMSRIVSITAENEDLEEHYFVVKMRGVSSKQKLLNKENIESYLVQHAPLPFSEKFVWGSAIKEKYKLLGYIIPEYAILLNGNRLYKAYTDIVVCDRVKKVEDAITDVEVKPLYKNEKVIAIIWKANLGSFGTVLNQEQKGIRVRQGNILIGTKTTCNAFFKEERFNGWLVGEVHVIDSDLIVNARRDFFEQNEAFFDLEESFLEWSTDESRKIRSISNTRHLEEKKLRITEISENVDVNGLDVEMDLLCDSESDFIDCEEGREVSEIDYFDKLSWIINQRSTMTKYMALNIKNNMTLEQRKTLEKVFDLLITEFGSKKSKKIIDVIVNGF